MIEAKDVSYKAGGKPILTAVNVGLKPGEVSVIVGPNGAGKSTLLKCLTGAQPPFRGSITLENRPLADYSLTALARKRAALLQSTEINFPFTAMEIVMMGRSPYGGEKKAVAERIAEQAMASVDAGRLRDRIFPTLSGGERQRVQLARTLAQLWEQRDGYLFLDEPTSALDLKHQHLTLNLVRRMASKKGMAVCLIMHDLNLALRYADRAILMKDGRVFKNGETHRVLNAANINAVFEVSCRICFPSNRGRGMVEI